MCSLHCTCLESVLKKGFHRVNNRLSTGFVKTYSNHSLNKRYLHFVLRNVNVTTISFSSLQFMNATNTCSFYTSTFKIL